MRSDYTGMFEKAGLVLSNKALMWSLDKGALTGAPYWLKSVIVKVWNHITCFIFGHTGCIMQEYKHVPPACTNCCRKIYDTKRYKVIELWRCEKEDEAD